MSQYLDFPILFTLFHPLEEIRPVAFKPPDVSVSVPKYTTITSPSKKSSFNDMFDDDEKNLSYITDFSFVPLQVSDERGYLLASSEQSITIWKLTEPNQSRELLFSSPYFIRSPSIFSPPLPKNIIDSPTARKEIKSTLEGIPPDLHMELVYEFESTTHESFFLDISSNGKKILLLLNDHKLTVFDISYFESENVLFTIENVEKICRYQDLMFFVVHTDCTLVLYEEEKPIIHLPFSNVDNIQKFGRQFIIFFNDSEPITFYFDISFESLIISILKVMHLALDPNSYSTILLSLSNSDSLSTIETFSTHFIDILIENENEENITKFINILHLLYEEYRVQKNTRCEIYFLSKILIQLSSHVNLPQFILYYILNSERELENFNLNSDYEIGTFVNNVPDLMYWISKCLTGAAMIDFSQLFKYTSKLSQIFSNFHKIVNFQNIIELVGHSKLTLFELNSLQPGISNVLKIAFETVSESPPLTWPIEAYKLIGRDDIARLHEYLINPSLENENDNNNNYEMSDLRFLEVERLLQSNISLTVEVERPNNIDDIEYQAMLMDRLKSLLEKQWSLSIGRGFFNYKTFQPFDSQSIDYFQLNKYGFTNDGIKLTPNEEYFSPEMIQWPEFHNGVSYSIFIKNVDRSWIINSITKEDNKSFISGLIFGFGLTGLLKQLYKTDYYQLITINDLKPLNLSSILISLGITYRSTKDMSISNILTLYVPELQNRFLTEENQFNQIIKSSSVIGIGFLYQSTCQRNITEGLIRMLESNLTFESPLLTLSIGIAIGLVSLGEGDNSNVLKENREKICGILFENKSFNFSNDKTVSFGSIDFYSFIPSIILLLTLSYLNTNNEYIQNILKLPNDSQYINNMNTDIILLRTMSSLLIDSDSLNILNFNIPNDLNVEALTSMITGFSLAIGIKFAGTMNIKAYERILIIIKCLSLLEKSPFDFSSCSIIHREKCLSLCVISCSLIIAGTCHLELLRLIRYIRRRQISTNLTQCIYGFHTLLGMSIGILNLGKGKYTINNDNNFNIACLIIALYPRITRSFNDNSFYLQSLRHLIVLTVIPRVIEIRNVSDNKCVKLPLRIILNDENEFFVNTPHVLPPLIDINSVEVNDSKYFVINLSPFPYKNEGIRPIIWVKKRNNNENYVKMNVKNLRLMLKFNENIKIGKFVLKNQKNIIKKYKKDLIWDNYINEILQFLRCNSVRERIDMLNKCKELKKFLIFYGISPSASINDICLFEDDAIAFLMQYLTEDEIQNVFG